MIRSPAPHPIEPETRSERPEANSGRREVHPVTVTATHDLGVARDDGDAARARRLGKRGDHAAQPSDFEALFEEYAQAS